jgi:simple sugar transport system substrate-binding protein
MAAFNRRLLLIACTLVLATSGGSCGDGGEERAGDRIVVGFSQIGAESGWRTANTRSIKEEAAKRGIDLRFSDAQGQQPNQVKALRAFIAQRVDAIAFSPTKETGWEPVLREAKRAGIPVLLTDREVEVSDPSLYVTFIGSNFVLEGRMAAEWLAEKTGGEALIAELQGTPGSSPAIDRKRGFEEAIAAHPGMRIVKSQSGNFERAKGKEVFESFLKSSDGRRITALYAHNDDMALGAIQAMEEAGVAPGKDILVVSIDGVKDAFRAMVAGKLNCSVECNPLIGPVVFDTIEKILSGEPVPKRILIEDRIFDQSVAADLIDSRAY